MFTANRLYDMDQPECMERLTDSQYHVGRLALHERELGLTILPVNYVVDGNRVIIRTGDGAIWAAAQEGASAAFEVDSLSGERPARAHEWSVLARGTLSTVQGEDEMTFLRLSRLDPDAGGLKPRFVAMGLDVLTGRHT